MITEEKKHRNHVTDKDNGIFFYMAPIRGITDASFRTLFHKYFGGCDAAIAPFINPQRHTQFTEKHLLDVLPEHNQSLPVIPQSLHTHPEDFLALSRHLAALGYQEINWNLGCPAPMVTKKKRGSGLLPHTRTIIEFLKTVLPEMTLKLSIKTRLGYEEKGELFRLLPLLNDFPLTEIIIHPRIGKQIYKGKPDLEAFDHCQQLTSHPLVYNGDIVTPETFNTLCQRFPKIQRWMLGRGLLADPFLPQRLRHHMDDGSLDTLKQFHDAVYANYCSKLFGDSHILGKLKQFWPYFIASFPHKTHLLKKIRKAKFLKQYDAVIVQLFE